MKQLTAQRITPSWMHHGEGPCWSKEWNGLAWVSVQIICPMRYREDKNSGLQSLVH